MRRSPLFSLLRTAAAAIAALGLCACATDGGPVGTGIIASVSGNVISVDEATTDGLGSVAQVEDFEVVGGIEVSIEGVDGATATTDDAGNFAIDGDFSGILQVRFQTPRFSVVETLEVPSGSVVVLADLELAPDGAEALGARQLDLTGRLESSDCTANTLLVSDEDGPESFVVNVDAETLFTRPDGQAVRCADLPIGARVVVDGLRTFPSDGTVTAQAVQVDAPGRREPQRLREVSFIGVVTALDCEANRMVLFDGRHRTGIQLGPDTRIELDDGTPIDCDGIELGDRAGGFGELDTRNPGRIRARALGISPAEDERPEFVARGRIGAIDCDAGTLVLAQKDTRVVVRILPSTTFDGVRDCQRLRPRNSVDVIGLRDPMARRMMDAIRIVRRGR